MFPEIKRAATSSLARILLPGVMGLVEVTIDPTVAEKIRTLPESKALVLVAEHQSHADCIGVLKALRRIQGLNPRILGGVYPVSSENFTTRQGEYTPLLMEQFQEVGRRLDLDVIPVSRSRDLRKIDRSERRTALDKSKDAYRRIVQLTYTGHILSLHPEGTVENGRRVLQQEQTREVDTHFIQPFQEGITSLLVDCHKERYAQAPHIKDTAFLIATVSGTPAIFSPIEGNKKPSRQAVFRTVLGSLGLRTTPMARMDVGDFVLLSELTDGSGDLKGIVTHVNTELRNRMIDLKG